MYSQTVKYAVLSLVQKHENQLYDDKTVNLIELLLDVYKIYKRIKSHLQYCIADTQININKFYDDKPVNVIELLIHPFKPCKRFKNQFNPSAVYLSHKSFKTQLLMIK